MHIIVDPMSVETWLPAELIETPWDLYFSWRCISCICTICLHNVTMHNLSWPWWSNCLLCYWMRQELLFPILLHYLLASGLNIYLLNLHHYATMAGCTKEISCRLIILCRVTNGHFRFIKMTLYIYKYIHSLYAIWPASLTFLPRFWYMGRVFAWVMAFKKVSIHFFYMISFL